MSELVERAVALRALLVEQAPETERRTYYSQELHEAFDAAGFYRMLVPRRFGGLEVDLATFLRVIIEVAAGDLSDRLVPVPRLARTRCTSATLFEERAQAELFGDGDFRSPAVAAPAGSGGAHATTAGRSPGTWAYCSGAPYATHYMGQTFEAPRAAGRAARPDPAVRRAAQPVDDARRLGRHARAAGQRLALDPPRARARARPLRARGPVAASTPTRRAPRASRCTATRSTPGGR